MQLVAGNLVAVLVGDDDQGTHTIWLAHQNQPEEIVEIVRHDPFPGDAAVEPGFARARTLEFVHAIDRERNVDLHAGKRPIERNFGCVAPIKGESSRMLRKSAEDWLPC